MALDPSEEAQSDSGSKANGIKNAYEQAGVNNNSSELIRDEVIVTKGPGLLVNGIEDKVSVMGLGDGTYGGASGAIMERRKQGEAEAYLESKRV